MRCVRIVQCSTYVILYERTAVIAVGRGLTSIRTLHFHIFRIIFPDRVSGARSASDQVYTGVLPSFLATPTTSVHPRTAAHAAGILMQHNPHSEYRGYNTYTYTYKLKHINRKIRCRRIGRRRGAKGRALRITYSGGGGMKELGGGLKARMDDAAVEVERSGNKDLHRTCVLAAQVWWYRKNRVSLRGGPSISLRSSRPIPTPVFPPAISTFRPVCN